jgi:hypothetical protein
MDFDIGNIFYIVITLVAVTIGLLGKKKKPAPGGSDVSGSVARPGFLENLERVLQMGQDQPRLADREFYEEDLSYEEEMPVEKTAPVGVSENRSPSVHGRGIMENYDRIMNRSTDGEMELIDLEGESTTEATGMINLDDNQGTDFFEIIRDFDAATAIVYSSIINRLDY